MLLDLGTVRGHKLESMELEAPSAWMVDEHEGHGPRLLLGQGYVCVCVCVASVYLFHFPNPLDIL